MRFKTIDAHAEGGLVRLIVEGFPSVPGATMEDKERWALEHAEELRCGALLEPRGHADMCGAVLTEPVTPGAHAGLLFMHAGGYAPMSGHGVLGVTTIALERGLLMPGGDGATVVYDTVAGSVRAVASRAPHDGVKVHAVTVQNVPAFVWRGNIPITIDSRRMRVDIAFGGAFYAVVDSEAAGVGVNPANAVELRRVGSRIREAVESAHRIVHPVQSGVRGVFGTIFTGPPSAPSADLKNVVVFGQGQIERSPGGTATAAVMAILGAMGLAAEDASFVQEGVLGTILRARIAGRTTVGDYDAIVCETTGSAFITGDHAFTVDRNDPLAEGFLGPT